MFLRSPMLIPFAVLALATSTRAAEPPGPLVGARLLQVTLPAKDLEQAAAFYRDILGMKFLFRAPDAVFLDAGGIRLRLEKSDATLPVGAVELYFDDPGLSRLKPLADRGVRFVGPPETVQHLAKTDLQLAEFTDPDGNALALMGEVPRH